MDVPSGQLVQNLAEPGVQRRFAPAQHHDVEPAVFALEALIDRGKQLLDRYRSGDLAR